MANETVFLNREQQKEASYSFVFLSPNHHAPTLPPIQAMHFPSLPFLSLLLLTLLSTLSLASPLEDAQLAKRAGLLRDLAIAKGKYFGTATLVSEFQNDATYKSVGGNFVSLSVERRGEERRGTEKEGREES